MNCEPKAIITLSDWMVREAGSGKLTLVGIFHRLRPPTMPFRTGRFFATVSLTNLRGSFKVVNVTLRVEQRGTAHVVFSASAKIEFKQEHTFSDYDVLDIPIPVGPIPFQEAGTFDIVVLVDSDECGRKPLRVEVVTAGGLIEGEKS